MPQPIAILGSGVSGLTTAVTLAARGREVIVYSDPSSAGASSVAPAMFTPYAPADSPSFRSRTESSLKAFARLAEGAPPRSETPVPDDGRSPAHGVRFGELREYRYSPAPTSPEWLDRLLDTRSLKSAPPVLTATASRRPHIEMDRYLPWLIAAANGLGVRSAHRRVRSFDEVFDQGHATVINCTGLGSRRLVEDPSLRPMHGQVLHVPNDIGLDYSLHDDAPNGLVAYVFCFGDRLVLGGTFESGREHSAPDDAAIDAIVHRCRNLLRLDGHPHWEELAQKRVLTRAAARPARGEGDCHEDIRLERIELAGGRTLIHNYGHGRTGVTLSWGCAEEAADLAAAPPSR